VGINTFLDAYMESQNDNDDYNSKYAMINYNSYGEEFDASEYMECKEFERGEQEENNQQQQNNNYQGQYNGYYQDSQVFIGPGCTEDGLSIALHTYVDEDCSYPFQGNFSMVSSHWETLPFSDGGLVSMDCVSCAGQDNDGNLEVSEMCKQDYESSVYRCEQLMETNSSYFYATTSGCDYVENLVTEVYNNLTAGDAFAQVKAAVSETAKVVGTKFMDTMSTREAQAFIAGMVVFGISVFIGVTFVGCLLVKKRRKRLRLKKQTKLLPSGGADDGLPVSPSSVAKRRSSVVAFVRSSTNNIKQSVQAAVGSVTAATSTLSKKENGEDDGTVKSDYNNMTDAVTQTTGSYTAPQPALSSDTAPEEEILTNTSKPVITGTSSDEVPFVDETTALEEADLASELPPSTEELSEVPPSEDAIQIDESVTNSTAPDKMTGGRFLSKMDKHLKKKMSVKSMIKRK